jgi:hypothetical protein
MAEEEFSELRIMSTPEKFTFAKVQTTNEAKIEEFKNEIKKNRLVPFTLEKCGKVYHLYFYGKEEKVKDICKLLYEKGGMWCARVVRGSIGGIGCTIKPLEIE